MTVITLTSDLGTRDYYLAAVKGYIINKLPDANIIDISHQIEPFNIAQASFILQSCFKEFPKGSIHLINVESDVQMKNKYILVQTEDYFFLAPDNGIISLVLGEDTMPTQIISLDFEIEQLSFPLKNILAKAAIQLAQNNMPETLGSVTTNFVRRSSQSILGNDAMIRGVVIYIDRIGNAITNISIADLEKYGYGRDFQIYISRTESIDKVSKHYNEVEEGDLLCLFNSQKLLEIAINKGNASGLLGLKTGSPILIEFV